MVFPPVNDVGKTFFIVKGAKTCHEYSGGFTHLLYLTVAILPLFMVAGQEKGSVEGLLKSVAQGNGTEILGGILPVKFEGSANMAEGKREIIKIRADAPVQFAHKGKFVDTMALFPKITV